MDYGMKFQKGCYRRVEGDSRQTDRSKHSKCFSRDNTFEKMNELGSELKHMQVETGMDISRMSSLGSGVSSELMTLTKDMDRVSWRCRPISHHSVSSKCELGKVQRARSFPSSTGSNKDTPERYRLDGSRIDESIIRCKDLDAKISRIVPTRSFDAIPVGNTALLKAIYPDKNGGKLKDEILELNTQLRKLDSELKNSRSEIRSSLRANAVLRDANSQLAFDCHSLEDEVSSLKERLRIVRTDKSPVARPQEPVCLWPVEMAILQDRVCQLETETKSRDDCKVIKELNLVQILDFVLVSPIIEEIPPADPSPNVELSILSDQLADSKSSVQLLSRNVAELSRSMSELSVENGILRRKLMLELYHTKEKKDQLSTLEQVHEATLSQLAEKSNQIKSIQNGNGPFLRKIRQLSNTIDSLHEEIFDLKQRYLKRAPVTLGGKDRPRPPPIETD